MNFSLPRLLRLALCALGALASFATAHAEVPTKDELAKAAAWFDGLEWPDLRGKPYVELTFGQHTVNSKTVDGPKQRGFLLSEDDESWSIFCDGATPGGGLFWSGVGWPLSTTRVKKTGLSAVASSKITLRVLDLVKAVDEVLADVTRKEEDADNLFGHFGAKLSEPAEVFTLARFCARQGQAELAAKLDDAVLRLAALKRNNREPNATFRATLEQEISTLFIWKAVVAFGDLSVSRAQLLTQFERIVRLFPESKHRVSAERYVTQLRRLIDEDAAHPAVALAKMTPAEQAHEWIFRLRDQNGQQWSQPGSCDIFTEASPAQPESSPAHQLLKLGHTAVPALLSALEDDRLTRSVGFHRDFRYSHSVLTVGHCALSILSRIASRNFNGRAQAEAWWTEVTAKGEMAVLIETVSAGGQAAGEQARRLRELDPAAAVAAIAAGLSRTPAGGERSRMLDPLFAIKTEDATKLLLGEMQTGPSCHARIMAARLLFARGDRTSIPAIIREWNALPFSVKTDGVEGSNAETLIGFLASCDDPAALQALRARFTSAPVDLKLHLVESLSQRGDHFHGVRQDKAPVPKEIQALQEDMLIAALEDRTARYGMAGSRSGAHVSISYRDPRVCDIAAFVLAENWPDRYPFTALHTQIERDARNVEFGNVWRATHGQPLRPPIQLPSHQAAARDPNTVAALRWSGGPALRNPPLAVGQPLSADELVTLLIRLNRELPEDCVGYHLLAERPAGGHGFIVEIGWMKGERPLKSNDWHYLANFQLASVSLDNSGGSRAGLTLDAEALAPERRAFTKALAGTADQPISISYLGSLRGDWNK